MTRTTMIACAALFAATAAPALAGQNPRAEQQASTARIVVVQCERDALTQASFRRNHGARPEFVTTEQVLSARASGERWATPRCMTASEHRRLSQRLGVPTAL